MVLEITVITVFAVSLISIIRDTFKREDENENLIKNIERYERSTKA